MLSDSDLDRYARHLVLREVGGQGQTALRAAKVLVVGAGGLGSPLLLYLAAAGVGTLGIVDDDRVSLSNLQRQILHATGAVDTLKTDSAARALKALNDGVETVLHPLRLDPGNADAVIAPYDLVCDGTDSYKTRALVNRCCARARKPLITGAIGQWEGQVSVHRPWLGGPCWECVFPQAPAPGLAPSCAEGGVIGALPGVIGSLMAMEAIKLIVDTGAPLDGRLLLYDALGAEMRTLGIARRPGCPACGVT